MAIESFGETSLLVASALTLVSWWKPILLLAPFTAWAWVISTIFDKDAQRWFFKRRVWNLGHLLVGFGAVAVGLLTPIFWIGLPLVIVILVADLGVYYALRNKDERVPAHQHWSLSVSDMLSKSREAGKDSKSARVKGIELTVRGPSGVIKAPEKETPEWDIRVAADSLLARVIDGRGSRFEIAPVDQQNYAFAFTVDGVLQTPEKLPAPQAVAIIDFVKRAAGLDLEDRRRKQTGDFKVTRTNVDHTLRVTTQGGSGGVRVLGLLNPESQVQRTIDQLGLLPGQLDDMKGMIDEGKGVVLLAAPGQQGRTTTLYALLRSLDAYTSNIQTLELQPQAYIEGVRHNVFDPAADGAEYATTLRSILRRDPDAVGTGETPDAETAKEAARADHERTRVFLSMKAENALQALQMYVKAVGDMQTAAEGLHGLVAQRLVRRLCPNCKTAYQPAPDMLRKLGLPADKVKQLHRKGGQVLIKNKPEVCPMCAGVGYLEQEGVFEVHPLGREEREMIASGDMSSLKASFRKKRQPSIQEAALRKAVEGVTSVEEVVRVTAGKSGQAGKPAPAA